MQVISEPAHSSLGQRIAKVRNCMLVEVATGVSVTNKELFVSLCQTYEQQSVVPSCLLSKSHEALPYWISSISKLTQESSRSQWPTSIVSRNVLLWQRDTDFLVTDRPDFGWADDDVGFSDWDKWVDFLVAGRVDFDDTEVCDDKENFTN
jgi:hypothetical protein